MSIEKTPQGDKFLDDDAQASEFKIPEPAKTSSKAPKEGKTKEQGPVTKINDDPPVETSVRKIRRKTGSRLPANLPVSEKAAPPITRRKYAMYKLIAFDNAYDARVDPPYNKIEAQPYELVNRYIFYDPFEEVITDRQKVLEFTVGVEAYTYVDQQQKTQQGTRPKYGIPRFTAGTVIVDTEKEYLQFLWYELHPRLEGGRFQDVTKKAWFRRVDTQHANPYLKVVEMNLIDAAGDVIKRMPNDQRKGLAAALNIPIRAGAVELEIDLREFARKNKENAERIMFTAPDKKISMKVKIAEAVENGILEYHEDLGQWMFSSDIDPLHVVLDSKDPLDDLADYFAGKGEDDYKEVIKQLERFKKGVS